MQYKTLYVTDDGVEFENEFDAMDYCEWQGIKVLAARILFYDKHLNGLKFCRKELAHDGFYGDVWYIDVHTHEEVRALRQLGEYTGWCGFITIDNVGMWMWDEEKEDFVRR